MTREVFFSEWNIKSLHIFGQTNFLAPAAAAKTELKLQSQLLKQKHPLPWPECLMLWSAIFYHSNTNVCHNLCQLRDEIINFFSVSVIKSPRNGQWPLAPVAGWWPRLCVVPGLPPDISIRAWPDHCTMEYLKGRDGHLFHELNKHFCGHFGPFWPGWECSRHIFCLISIKEY